MATLIYDGDCGFCKKWVAWLLDQSPRGLKVFPFQERPAEFRTIPDANLEKAVHFVGDDGRVTKGAEAFFNAMELRPQGTILRRFYEKFRPFRFAADTLYRLVATHRNLAAWVTYLFWGEDVVASRYEKIRRAFLAVLGFCYFDAFVSLAVQIKGLMGQNGILPAAGFLDSLGRHPGVLKYFVFPTIGWFAAGNGALMAYCIAGAVAAALLVLNVAPRLSAVVCWGLYLSLVTVGSLFLGYQWEELLLEAGFLAIILAPAAWWPTPKRPSAPRPTVVWLYRWLFFRLIFTSGVAKLADGDAHWRGLTALNYHFETQPLPTFIAWYAAHLPQSVLKAMTFATLVIETAVPLLFFLPRRMRIIAFWLQLLLQVSIMLTGNYGFFNVLTIGLSLFLLDDQFLEKVFKRKTPRTPPAVRNASGLENMKRAALLVLSAVLIVAGSVRLVEAFTFDQSPVIEAFAPLLNWTERYFIVGSYGLFVNMTTERDEVIIEGSQDGNSWIPYEFPYKPGDPSLRPKFVAPYQPRLDWQMWFAALGDFKSQPWLQNLAVRLLQGQKEVLGLFNSDPFQGQPPRYIRMTLFEYHFSDPETRKQKGLWWVRSPKGPFSPVMSLSRE